MLPGSQEEGSQAGQQLLALEPLEVRRELAQPAEWSSVRERRAPESQEESWPQVLERLEE